VSAVVAGVVRHAELEDEQRDRDREDTVAERFQPAEREFIRHTLQRCGSLRCTRDRSR
jgi:hypothetical protein